MPSEFADGLSVNDVMPVLLDAEAETLAEFV
jgi:hypothetical protein